MMMRTVWTRWIRRLTVQEGPKQGQRQQQQQARAEGQDEGEGVVMGVVVVVVVNAWCHQQAQEPLRRSARLKGTKI